jgi:hypothetical protein
MAGYHKEQWFSEKAALAGTLAAACCCCSDESIFDATHYMRLVENDFKQRSENTMDRAVHQPRRRRWMGAGGENAVAIFDRRFWANFEQAARQAWRSLTAHLISAATDRDAAYSALISWSAAWWSQRESNPRSRRERPVS